MYFNYIHDFFICIELPHPLDFATIELYVNICLLLLMLLKFTGSFVLGVGCVYVGGVAPMWEVVWCFVYSLVFFC